MDRNSGNPSGCILALDLDGVLVHPSAGLDGAWNTRLAADLGIDPAALGARFFGVHSPAVIVGRRDLKESLGQVLPGLHPAVTVEELTAYWFSRDARLDQEVAAELSSWKRRTGGQAIAASNQEKYRVAFLRAQLGLDELFSRIFWSGDLGMTKSDPGFFHAAAASMNADPDRIWFFDDDPQNIAVASAAGWRAFQFTGAAGMRKVLEADFPS